MTNAISTLLVAFLVGVVGWAGLTLSSLTVEVAKLNTTMSGIQTDVANLGRSVAKIPELETRVTVLERSMKGR